MAIEEAVVREEELLPLATICRRFDRLADEQREANRRKMASGKYTIIDVTDDSMTRTRLRAITTNPVFLNTTLSKFSSPAARSLRNSAALSQPASF